MRNLLSRAAPAIVAGAVFIGAAGATSAASVSTAILLNVDGSSSISGSDFGLQVGAYETLLAGVPTDGSVAIGALQFADATQSIFPLTQINSEADRMALTSAFGATTQIQGLTDIAGSINVAATSLLTFGIDCSSDDVNCLIDVSTDGLQTIFPGDPLAAANAAVAGGVDQVNCLGVGAAQCGFIAGSGAFSVFANDFGDFSRALQDKLSAEGIIPVAPIPVPASALLLLTGLAGMFGWRRLSGSAA